MLSAEVKAVLRLWYGDDLLDGVRALRGSFFGWLFGLNGNHAVTINGTVHVTRRAPLEGSLGWTVLIGHELYHVEQQAAMGWWPFLLRYLWRYRPHHLRSARSHPYEVPACKRGAEIRAAVGEGRALTKRLTRGSITS